MSELGRPTLYTPELAETICQRLAEGESLRHICKADDFPDHSTVTQWVVQDREGFSNQYARARQAQALLWADEIVSIADNKEPTEIHQRSRLRVDTRKWLLSKVLPKVYGDKVLIGGDGGDPIKIEDVNDTRERLRDRIAGIATRVGTGQPDTEPDTD